MTENNENQKYESLDDRYFKMTRSQLRRMEALSVFYGYPYDAPFFGFRLENDKPHPYAENQIKEWEKTHGPLPPISIIEDVPGSEESKVL